LLPRLNLTFTPVVSPFAKFWRGDVLAIFSIYMWGDCAQSREKNNRMSASMIMISLRVEKEFLSFPHVVSGNPLVRSEWIPD
jgi:hypothetical protein